MAVELRQAPRRPSRAHRIVKCASLLLIVITARPLAAQKPSGATNARSKIEPRIARLIDRLASDSYQDRIQASDELATLGLATRPQLTEAARHRDPEVRLRAKELLRRLQIEELWSGATVRYRSDKAPASAALVALAEQTGNRVLVGDQYGAFHDQPVTVDGRKASFWEVLDKICRDSGNRVRPHFDTRQPGLVLVAGNLGRNPVAYAGPVRAQITGARRTFTEELDYERQESELNHTFQFDFQMLWEDRFRLVAYRAQPELARAVTDTGAELSAAHPATSGWNIAGGGTRQLTMNLRLQPPSTAAKELKLLELKWGLIAVADPATIEIVDLQNTAPRFQDDVELTVESFQQGPGPRCELTLVVLRDLVAPEPQELLFHENEVELWDTDGKAYRKQGQTNTAGEFGARMKITFGGESATSKPGKLKFTYPRLRAQRDLAVVFQNVPLPRTRPE